jgi:hypothetical protein
MQQGSVILTSRKYGPDVWQFRWSEKDRSGRRIYHSRVIGTIQQLVGSITNVAPTDLARSVFRSNPPPASSILSSTFFWS